MKIEGYVICQPVETWGNKDVSPWHPRPYTFGTTPYEAWTRFLMMTQSDADWDRKLLAWTNRGYCPKKTTMEIEVAQSR